MSYTVRPISDRTAFTGYPVESRFTVTWSQCTELLFRELDWLKARDLVIEVDVEERHIRNDGLLRADAKARSNAVRIAFESDHGPLTYATDEFIRPSWRAKGMREDWQHNVYAIAKSLEALRMVDRYGVTKRGEQYAGFKALPAGRGAVPLAMTGDEARAILMRYAGVETVGSHPDWKKMLRQARFATHPDQREGDRTRWDLVEEAAKVLRLVW